MPNEALASRLPEQQVRQRTLLNAKQIEEKFPFLTRVKQCRLRLKGGAFRWFAIDRRFFAYEDEILTWIESTAIHSTAELPASFHSGAYKKLPELRKKALKARRAKQTAKTAVVA